MIQIIYCSRITKNLDRQELIDLVTISAVNNKNKDITGLLIYGNGYFLQVLEGDLNVLMELLKKLGADRRHKDIKILSQRNLMQREFPGWAMELINSGQEKEFFNQYAKDGFDPYSFNNKDALLFVLNAKAWRAQRLLWTRESNW